MDKVHRLLAAVAACGFLLAGQPARAEKAVTGASHPTQQRPFHALPADVATQGAQSEGVGLQRPIANQGPGKRPSDVEDFIMKGVNAKRVM